MGLANDLVVWYLNNGECRTEETVKWDSVNVPLSSLKTDILLFLSEYNAGDLINGVFTIPVRWKIPEKNLKLIGSICFYKEAFCEEAKTNREFWSALYEIFDTFWKLWYLKIEAYIKLFLAKL